MIIPCPKCNTKYRIKDELIKRDGIKLKCSRCGHIFQYTEESPGEIEQEKTVDRNIDKQSEIKKISLGETVLNNNKPGSSKKTLGIILGVVVVILIGFIVYRFYPIISKNIPFLSSRSELKQIKQQTTTNATSIESIKNIVIEDIKQYIVENEKEGKILVIEGRAVNKFDKPKELIKLEATLYDNKGNVLVKKRFLCGNKVSLFQLQSWSKKHLEAQLNSKVGILMKNTNIPPGGSVDFMVLFFNPPSTMAEFGLQVVEASDVEEK
jgi:predicted Zn finger-like uncharacterized protein